MVSVILVEENPQNNFHQKPLAMLVPTEKLPRSLISIGNNDHTIEVDGHRTAPYRGFMHPANTAVIP